MMLNTLKRFAHCNIRGIYLKTSGQQLYSSSSNSELAANAGAPEQSRPAGPLIKGDNNNDNEIDIATGLFDNSSVTHKPGKPAALQRPTPKEVKASLSLKNDFVRETEKRPRKKPAIVIEPKLHGRVLYDRTMDMEIIRLERQNDPLITELLTKVRSRKRRDKNSEILVEGHRLIAEALQCGLRMNALIFSQVQQLKNIHQAVSEAQHRHQTKIYKVGQHDIKTWSTLVTPPGLMAIFQRPDGSGLKRTSGGTQAALPVTVVCDNIREPNNLGSIIRTCAALPCHQVLVTRGCCDPWESKALRGGCGGQFRVRIQDDCDWSQLQGLMPQLAQGQLSVLVAESNVQKAPPQTATVAYTDLEMRGDHCVVIIGGESHGISPEAYDFLASAGQTNGQCVHIPLANGVESLNVTSALTLILYELRRNLQQKLQSAPPPPPPEQQN